MTRSRNKLRTVADIWAKFKSLGWVAAAIAVLTAIGLALAAAQAQSRRDRATKNERAATVLLTSNVKTEIAKGEKLQASAENDKKRAALADAKMEARLETLASNDSLDAIADRFNSRRVRERANDPAA